MKLDERKSSTLYVQISTLKFPVHIYCRGKRQIRTQYIFGSKVVIDATHPTKISNTACGWPFSTILSRNLTSWGLSAAKRWAVQGLTDIELPRFDKRKKINRAIFLLQRDFGLVSLFDDYRRNYTVLHAAQRLWTVFTVGGIIVDTMGFGKTSLASLFLNIRLRILP